MKRFVFFLPVLLLATIFVARTENPAGPVPTPIDGKIEFSSQPFSSNAGTKTSFTSAEYVYARMELNSQTIREAFKLKEKEGNPAYLQVLVNILKGGEIIHYGSNRQYILLPDEFKDSKTLYVDLMPEASKATTLHSMVDDFRAGLGMNPLISLIRNGRHPTGDYKIRLTLYYETYNAYGSLHDEDKWPALSGEFDYRLSEDDVEQMFNNDKKVTETIVENAFRYDRMPPVFSSPGKLTDPNATQAKIAAILKRDLPKRQILKWVAESYDGPYWHIAKDDYGLPRYKYFNPHIWMAYKIDGKCYVGHVTLRQVYSGGGTYGPLQVAFTSASGSLPDRGIDCAKVK